jgi:hypothetical protein
MGSFGAEHVNKVFTDSPPFQNNDAFTLMVLSLSIFAN